MKMRKFYWAVLLSASWAMPAMAADVMTTSKVDHVTVFPQGADVTRVADVTLVAGEHRILIKDLPAGVDPRSIRVKGSDLAGVAISAVDTRSPRWGLRGLTWIKRWQILFINGNFC
jgi:N-terminal domain of unknown function (DUF4140)